MLSSFLVAVMGLALGQGAATGGCTIASAKYVAVGQPQYRLSFARLGSGSGTMSDVALHVRSGSGGGEAWYYFDRGSARRVALVSTNDPTSPGWKAQPDGGVRPFGSATFIGMSKAGAIADMVPNSSSAAPDFVVIPELAETFRGREYAFRAAAFVLDSCS